MNASEQLLRYLSKVKGSISFTLDCNGKGLVTVKVQDKIIYVTSSVKEVINKLKTQLSKIK